MTALSRDAVNRFRAKRGRALAALIRARADRIGRGLEILDLGGRADYWGNIGLDGIARIVLLNNEDPGIGRRSPYPGAAPPGLFRSIQGDARDLSAYADQSVDLVHANSVIEHVGGWSAMRAMAGEMMRVGRAGWAQTPAFEFPFEPHFHVPFAHWLGRPAQARAMALSLDPGHRRLDRDGRRRALEDVDLVTKGEMRLLFPGRPLLVERFAFLPKSYVVHWAPEAG